MKWVRRDDVTKYISSSGVVFGGLPEGGISFALPVSLKCDCRR